MDLVRKRKGLPVEEKLVQHAEKQVNIYAFERNPSVEVDAENKISSEVSAAHQQSLVLRSRNKLLSRPRVRLHSARDESQRLTSFDVLSQVKLLVIMFSYKAHLPGKLWHPSNAPQKYTLVNRERQQRCK